MEPSNSPSGELNSTDWYKAGRGLLVVLAGATLTYLADALPNIDFGAYTPVVISLSSTFIELGRRYLTNYSSL